MVSYRWQIGIINAILFGIGYTVITFVLIFTFFPIFLALFSISPIYWIQIKLGWFRTAGDLSIILGTLSLYPLLGFLEGVLFLSKTERPFAKNFIYGSFCFIVTYFVLIVLGIVSLNIIGPTWL